MLTHSIDNPAEEFDEERNSAKHELAEAPLKDEDESDREDEHIHQAEEVVPVTRRGRRDVRSHSRFNHARRRALSPGRDEYKAATRISQSISQ